MSTRTMDAENNMYHNAAAIINGTINVNEIATSIAREPFSFYLKRYVSEKSKISINDMTLEDIMCFFEKNICNYSDDTKESIESWFPIQRVRRVTRDCLNYIDDRNEYPIKVKRIIKNNQKEYDEFLSLKSINKRERNDFQKKRYRELNNFFTNKFNNIKPREMSRASLLKLFFYLNCSLTEADDLLQELGECGFYFKNREELLILWSLSQENKFESYYRNLYLLKADKIYSEIYVGNTKDYENKILNDNGLIRNICEDELKEIILSLETNSQIRSTALEVYRKVINEVNSNFTQKFEHEEFKNRKSELLRKIENNCHYQKNVENLKELNKKMKNKENTAYRRISDELAKRYNRNIIAFKSEKIKRIINGELHDNVDRKDLITGLFLLFVLENYYDAESCDIFDTIYSREELKDLNEFEDLVRNFEESIDDSLVAIDMQMINMTNPYDAFLCLCLATPSPVATFCAYSDDYFENEEVNEI